MNFTRLRTFAAGASLPRPDAPVLGRTQNFYRVLGKNFVGCSFTLDSPVRQVAVSAPGDRDSYGCVAPAGNEQGPAATTESACANGALPPTSRRPFAGMPEAQATARQRVARPERSPQARVFTHRTERQPETAPAGSAETGGCASSCLSESGLTTGCRQAAGSRRCARQTEQHCSSQNQAADKGTTTSGTVP